MKVMKQQDFRFDAYAEKDRGEFTEMVFALYDEDPTGMPITEDKIIKTINESVCGSEKVQIVMIRNGVENIGYGIITFSWSNEYGGIVVNIDELYIKKGFRNNNAGSSFIEHLQDTYKNAAMLTLEVTPENKDALRLYNRLGFEVSGNTHLLRVYTPGSQYFSNNF